MPRLAEEAGGERKRDRPAALARLGAVAAGEAAGGVDEGRDHPAMGDIAAVEMARLEDELQLRLIGAPAGEPIANQLAEADGRFEMGGSFRHGRWYSIFNRKDGHRFQFCARDWPQRIAVCHARRTGIRTAGNRAA